MEASTLRGSMQICLGIVPLRMLLCNRAYRVIGYEASDGQPRMHPHMNDLSWNLPKRINTVLYALWLDYRSSAEYFLSTKTYGLRLTGPYKFNNDWSVAYTAEFAKQMNYATNPSGPPYRRQREQETTRRSILGREMADWAGRSQERARLGDVHASQYLPRKSSSESLRRDAQQNSLQLFCNVIPGAVKYWSDFHQSCRIEDDRKENEDTALSELYFPALRSGK